MKKCFKSLLAGMLAIMLLFGSTAVDASAANATKKLRTNAVSGKTYTIQTVLPGNVKITEKVKIEYGEETYNAASGYYARSYNITATIPGSQLKKIKKNVQKINSKSPVLKRVGFYIYRRPFVSIIPNFMYANTGKILDGNGAGIAEGTSGTAKSGYHLMKQGNSQLEIYDTSNSYGVLVYTEANKGNVLVGMTGVAKPTFDNNKQFKKYLTGKSSITKTPFYSKKNKKLSIYAKF